LRRPQILPAFQLSGTEKLTLVNAPASHPVAKLGTFGATFKSVNIAGQIVNGQALKTVKVRAEAVDIKAKFAKKKDFMLDFVL